MYIDFRNFTLLTLRSRVFSFNKVESDFTSLQEFNDYQEDKEDIIYELVHNIDRSAAEARVKAYQQSHVDEIRTRLAQHSESDREMSLRVQRQREDNQAAVKEVQVKCAVLSRRLRLVMYMLIHLLCCCVSGTGCSCA